MGRVFSLIISISMAFVFFHAANAQADADSQKKKSDVVQTREADRDDFSNEENVENNKADEKKTESEKKELEKEIKKLREHKKELENQIKKIEGEKKEQKTEEKVEEQKEEKAVEEEKKEKAEAPEEKKEERAAVREKENKPPQKKKLSIIDKNSREYVALIFGYGGYFPVYDYSKSYKPAHHFSGTVGIYYLNFVGLSPELHVRYSDMGSKSQLLKFNSSISIVQMFPAIVYRYAIPLPRNTLTVYARIFDGVARVAYSSRNVYYFKENITEYINTFGLSTGCYYDVWKGFLLGIDLGYGIIFTAGKRLQAVSVMVTAGWRIL
jgi:DNA polymerase III alpha subunit (gram-positive type)